MNATEYLKHWESNEVWTHYKWPKHQRRFRQIAARLVGGSCVDVGCGLGHSTRILAGMYPANWTGLEFDGAAIEKARRNFPRISFVYAKDYGLAAACGRKYDSVVCSEVIEHVEDDKSFVDEVMKIASLKAVFTTPNRVVDDPGHLRLYTETMLACLFEGYRHAIRSIGGYFYIGVRK